MTYLPSSLDHVEDIELYRPGGFHPVHLGDTLANGRYRIIHKLGFGGYSTVLLAQKEFEERYIALKTMAAEASLDCIEFEVLQHLATTSCD